MLNRLTVEMLPLMKRSEPSVALTHQTGPSHFSEVRQAYDQAEFEADVRPYIDDMPSQLARTDLAVCRSGAMTVAELSATGTPAILVPLAVAIGGHQSLNAQAHVAAGAGWMIEESQLTPDGVWACVSQATPERLAEMAAAARRRARPDSAELVARRVLQLSEARSG